MIDFPVMVGSICSIARLDSGNIMIFLERTFSKGTSPLVFLIYVILDAFLDTCVSSTLILVLVTLTLGYERVTLAPPSPSLDDFYMMDAQVIPINSSTLQFSFFLCGFAIEFT